MSTTTPTQMSAAERMILALETPPWDSAYRALIGCGIMPVYLQLFGGESAPWKLAAFFLAILAALRIVPGVLRRLLPFSREVKAVWAERRALAKRYDSYQWRKLFGLGLGWLAYLLSTGKDRDLALFLAVGCVLAGALGLAFWDKYEKVLAAQRNAAALPSA